MIEPWALMSLYATAYLEDVVEAARYVETGQKTGNVVLTVNSA